MSLNTTETGKCFELLFDGSERHLGVPAAINERLTDNPELHIETLHAVSEHVEKGDADREAVEGVRDEIFDQSGVDGPTEMEKKIDE